MTYPPPQPVQKSKAGPIIAIVGVIVLLICLVCAGGFIYVTYWAKQKTDEIINNIPTDFPTNYPTGQGIAPTSK